jgi:hypothetical protein
MGFGLVTGFIKHLYTQRITASNYWAIANLHTLQITRAHAKSSQSAFTSCFLVTDLNNGDSSTYANIVTVWQISHNWLIVKSSLMTNSQLASLSWNKALIWGLWPDFITVRQLRVCWCGSLSLMRGRICRLHLLMVLSAVILGSESPETRDRILLSQIRDFPFRRLLRLAGIRWWYSTPPPHGISLD